MRFPIIGSCVLFSFFLLFKFLPKDLVNKILTGFRPPRIFASPPRSPRCLASGCPRLPSRLCTSAPTIPFFTDGPQRIEISIPEMIAALLPSVRAT